jgi:hypothetical protein
MCIQPPNNSVLIGDMPLACESQPRRVSCLLVDSSKMQNFLAKATRNKHKKSELFLVSLHFSKELGLLYTVRNSTMVLSRQELLNAL